MREGDWVRVGDTIGYLLFINAGRAVVQQVGRAGYIQVHPGYLKKCYDMVQYEDIPDLIDLALDTRDEEWFYGLVDDMNGSVMPGKEAPYGSNRNRYNGTAEGANA